MQFGKHAGKEGQGVAARLFAEEVMIVTHGLTRLGQSLKQIGLSEGNLCGSLL